MTPGDQSSEGGKNSIEKRLFAVACLIAISVMGFWIIAGVIIGYQWPVMTLYSLGFIFFLSIYLLLKRGHSYVLLAKIFFTVGILLLCLGWFPSGGLNGAILNFFVLMYLGGLLIFPPKDYKVFMVILLVALAGLMVLNIANQALAAPYTNDTQRFTDITIAYLLMMVLVGIGIYVFKKEYFDDRQKIKLLNINLEQEKQKALSADKAKTQFLATISHEMRTPLNGILGLTEFLTETDLNKDQKQLVRDLKGSSELLQSLISDVLDLTQIEDQKLVLHPTKFDLKKDIDTIIQIFKTRLDSSLRPVMLDYQHDYHISDILIGDALRLKQILVNLISNAIKFTDEGSITVSSELIETKDDDLRVKFVVEDTGVGIEEKDRKKLFDKFYQVNRSSYQSQEGTGLGLAICKNLVELMHGTIGLTSAPGQGSKFYFELPFIRTDEPAAVEQAIPEDDFDLSNLSVLIAEDSAVNQVIVRRVLNKISITKIDLVADGVAALEKATSKSYDFILMDIRMPKLDGLEASKRIIDYYAGQGKTAPTIIALTANALKEDIEECLSVGIADVIIKPFRQQTLKLILSKFARKK